MEATEIEQMYVWSLYALRFVSGIKRSRVMGGSLAALIFIWLALAL